MSCNKHDTTEVTFHCKSGCDGQKINVDVVVAPLLQAIWEMGIDTSYSDSNDEFCFIHMEVNDFSRFMEKVSYVSDFTNKEEIEWAKRVWNYKCSFVRDEMLNELLYEHPGDPNLKDCNIQYCVEAVICIPIVDIPIIKLKSKKELPQTKMKLHKHTLDAGVMFHPVLIDQ